MPFFHVPAATIGFAAALLLRSVPWEVPSSSNEQEQIFSQYSFKPLISSIFPPQSEASSCGYAVVAALSNLTRLAACMTMLKTGSPSEEISRAQFQNDKSVEAGYGKRPPISFADMCTVLENQGFELHSVRIDLSSISEVIAHSPLPPIIHLEDRWHHFILAIDMAKENEEIALVFDPAQGTVLVNISEVVSRASGYCLIPSSFSLGLNAGEVADLKEGLEALKRLMWIIAH